MLLHCETCAAKVSAKVHAQYDCAEWSEEQSGESSHVRDYRVVFLSCPECDEPMVAEIALLDGHTYGGPSRVYPPVPRAKPRVPATLRRFFDEALKCQRSRAVLAAVLMCRRTLEGVCQEKGASDGNLYQKLKKLHEAKVIDDRLYAWAEALRQDGNLAAHDPTPDITGEDARDLIGFTEAILDYVFVLHDQFERYQERRTKRAANNGREQVPKADTSGE